MDEASATSDQAILLDTASATSSPELVAGPLLYDSPDGLSLFPSGPEVVPVSHSRRRASDKENPTSDTSGLSFSGSSESVALQLSLASKLQALMGCDGSMEYALIWKERVTPLQRRICALRASARHTSASDCTGWPTPDGTTRVASKEPTAKNRKSGHHKQLTIQDAAKLAGWGTPAARDHKGKPADGFNEGNLHHQVELAGWGTPRVSTNKGMGSESRATDGQSRLEDQVQETDCLSTAETESTAALALNPAFSRWLMQYPAAWDEASPNWADWLAVQGRIASGG